MNIFKFKDKIFTIIETNNSGSCEGCYFSDNSIDCAIVIEKYWNCVDDKQKFFIAKEFNLKDILQKL